MPAPLKLVYSFAPEDDTFYKQLSRQLSPLVRQGLLSEWHEGLILPGNNGTHERLHAWRSADIILLLLSADYLASTDYTSQELQEAIEHHRAGQTRVIPILIRSCDWQSSILAQPQLQCLPRNGIPVTKWDDRDEALLSVAQEIRHLITTRQTSGIPLTQDQRTNRQRLLRHIRRIWIDGYLEQSLQHAVWIDLHLQKEPDSIERSWGLMVQELDRGPRRLPPGTSMLQVLEEADEELLILGDPGSGKTTLLLYLARTLLDRAESDEGRRIPVVFNLSSWSEQKLPLDQWLVAELKVRYQVPAKIGQAWIENNQIFPLLDGLDEIAESARAACVQAIIAYTQHSLDRSPLILCCRTQEYRALTQPPPTSYAIMLLPFTDEQMEVYLSSISGPVDTLREALREDPELFELAHRPLMLSIFAQAYQDATPANLPPTDQPQDYPQMLFRHYVKHMLTRRGRLRRATEEQMLAWLTYFATQLYQQQRTMFAVEELQPFWLPERYRPIYRWSMPIVYALIFGLFFGPFFGLFFGLMYSFITHSSSISSFGINFGLIVGVLGGLFGGLVFGVTFKHHQIIQPAEITVWSWKATLHSMRAWVIGGLAVGGAAGVAGDLIAGPIGGVGVGVAAFLVLVFVGIIVGGLPPVQIPEKTSFSPNEGIWRSGRRGLLLVLPAILLFGLAGGFVFGLFGTSIVTLSTAPTFGLVLGIAGGLAFGLAFGIVGGRTGLAAFLQHFTLRLFLWRLKLLPWNLVAFLDEAAHRLLLRKIGGSYTFVHRLLRDVLATS